MGSVSRSHWVVALVSAPPALVTLAWLTVLGVSWATSQHPIWTATPRNLTEAAALRDGAAIVRLVERGEHLDRPGEIRRDILSTQTRRLTPVEAAAGARDREILQLLIDLGAVFDALVWQGAWCISNAAPVRELLTVHRPAGAEDYCDPAIYDY